MRTQNDIGLNANKAIYDAIQSIAKHTIINPRTNTFYRGSSVSGFVAKIHNDPNDELFGTIDVKEWNAVNGDENDLTKEGYHVGVRLNAIQDSNKGVVMIPKLYSDVMIGQEPASGIEYVLMYSHVDIIQLDAHETVSIGVTERKDFEPNNDSAPDIDDLEFTGLKAVTTFTKDSVNTEVVDETGSKKVTQTIDTDSVAFNIAAGETVFKATKQDVSLKRDNATVHIQQDEEEFKVGDELIKVKSDGVYLGADTNTSHAVLGEELAQIICDILDMIAQIKTTTQLGPQPPLNIAQFITQKTKIKAWANTVTQFLTPKVNVQKK